MASAIFVSLSNVTSIPLHQNITEHDIYIDIPDTTPVPLFDALTGFLFTYAIIKGPLFFLMYKGNMDRHLFIVWQPTV